MKKLAIIASILAVVLAGCSKGQYLPLSILPSTTTTTTSTTTVDPITNFNTVWATTDTSPVLTITHLRTLSNFLGYTTAHYAVAGLCLYGHKGEALTGDCYGSTDILRDYFPSTATYWLAYPAPLDLGSVASYTIRFAANVDSATRKLTPGSAYLDMTVDAAVDSFTVKFSTVKTALQVINNQTCSGVSCDKISVTFSDDCGDLTFKANVISGQLQNSTISFLNTPSSYRNAGCYYNNSLPSGIGANNAIPTTLPEGIHSYANGGTRGEIFQTVSGYAGIPIFVEQ